MKPISNYSAFERITSNMAKTYGKLKKGEEDDFAIELASIEGNLLKTHRMDKSHNGRRASEAIKICLFIIDGYINGCEYDLSKYKTPENEALVSAILMAFDPFTNQDIREELGDEYDLQSTDSLREYFTVHIQCLLRIEESIEMWTKRNGADGYFNFIEEFMGYMAPDNDTMELLSKMDISLQ